MKTLTGLYVIIDKALVGAGDPAVVVRGVLEGGAAWFQYRDKRSTDEEVAAALSRIAPLCRERGARLILNDRVRLVKECGTDGVHLGREDMPVREARGLLGEAKIIGRTVRTADEAIAAEADGADYLGVGAVFGSPTKPAAPVVGPGRIGEIRRAVALPIVAIGGINRFNVAEALAAGASAVAVASAVLKAPDPAAAAGELREAITAFGKNINS